MEGELEQLKLKVDVTRIAVCEALESLRKCRQFAKQTMPMTAGAKLDEAIRILEDLR